MKPIIIRGIASSTRVDLHAERMTRKALFDMARQINAGGIAISLDHSRISVGVWTKARVKGTKLYVKGEIDPVKVKYISKHLKLGLSIGGSREKFHLRRSGSSFKSVRICDRVALAEISIGSGPANKDSILTSNIDWIQTGVVN